jgi:superfamily II DNA or RNA helicase
MKQQREYQVKQIDGIADMVGKGFRRIVGQLATGGGKTVMFAGLTKRYLAANPDKNVLIAVHREELMDQARRTLYDWYGIIAEKVVSTTKTLPSAKVWATMIETANNRLKKRPEYFPNVGLIIIDEAHVGNFKKLLAYFPKAIVIGFTATPIYPSKKYPMKKDYEAIVTGIDIKGLIETWQDDHTQGLVPNMTFVVTNVDKQELAGIARGADGDYAQGALGDVYSSGKHVANCVDAYERFLIGKKTIVFNCNISHNSLVNTAFVDRGYNSRTLTGSDTKEYRREVLAWFKATPDAILNNVGILVAGFDEPSVLGVIENLSTLSLSKWLQTTGRGSRPYPGKDFFVIVDMGNNARTHGDWCAERDWAEIFNNPGKPKEGGIGAIKLCPECECMIAPSSKTCKFCGAIIAAGNGPKYDTQGVDFELFSDPVIDVKALIENTSDKKDYYSLHAIKNKIVNHYKVESMNDDVAYKVLAAYQEKVAEWCKEKGKPYNQWHKNTTAEWLFAEFKKIYNWEPAELQIDL